MVIVNQTVISRQAKLNLYHADKYVECSKRSCNIPRYYIYLNMYKGEKLPSKR